MAGKQGSVHRLKVTLREVRPPVWRRIEVSSDVTLGQLAALLEAAMGWESYHLHAFEVAGATYGMADVDPPPDELDEAGYRLSEVLSSAGSKMRWRYDFGDNWEHDVVVEAVGPPEPGVEYPVCLAGRRACPPEDCGGTWGYGELLQLLADPTLEDPEGRREWLGPDFDPAYFDPAEATAAMRFPRPF